MPYLSAVPRKVFARYEHVYVQPLSAQVFPSDQQTERALTMTIDTSIHSRALLVNLSISTWAARKYDKAITSKVHADNGASSDSGRYNKMLLPGDAKAYKDLVSLASSIRVAHYGHTLAWSDEGWRLLPTANYMVYTTWFRDQVRAFNDALDTFESMYPILRSNAQAKLNGMFRADDYPSTQDVRKRFAIAAQYSPVPAAGDIRVELATDQIGVIEQSITERVESATRLAMDDAWKRLHDCVAHIAERLSDPEAIFRDSLINNAREVCQSLKRLNVTNDPDLETMRERVEKEIASFSPDTLRGSKGARQSTANKAMEIYDTMRELYGSVA